MTFRDWAVPHSCRKCCNTQRATHLATSIIPTYEVPQSEAPNAQEIPALAELVLDMQELAETPAADLPAKLQALTDAYAIWITEQTAKIDRHSFGLTPYQDPAQTAIADCQTALNRIQAGIDLLKNNPKLPNRSPS